MKVEHQFYFSNEHIFPAVMRDLEICRGLLRRILPDKNLEHISIRDDEEQWKEKEAETEKTISFDAETKGIRLDAFCEDEDTWYNIEMECTKDVYLPLRFRYYGSTTDMGQLRKGDEYKNLKTSYIIFLCTFDLFGLNEPIYSFENYDAKNVLKLGDKTYKIIVNTKCMKPDLPKELKSLFDYMNRNEVDVNDDLICAIDRQVSIINRENSDWRKEAMWSREKYKIWELNRELEAIEKGRSEGIDIGTVNAKNAIAKNFKESGTPIQEIARNTGLSVEEVEAL